MVHSTINYTKNISAKRDDQQRILYIQINHLKHVLGGHLHGLDGEMDGLWYVQRDVSKSILLLIMLQDALLIIRVVPQGRHSGQLFIEPQHISDAIETTNHIDEGAGHK